MSDIVDISALSTWSLREIITASNLNTQLVAKLDLIYGNQVIINDDMGLLLQGAGAEQAKIPFIITSAPTGWTRDVSADTDHVLRVTDGSTVPPGTNPTAVGGAKGGSWTVAGLASSVASAHTHTLSAHTHGMENHTHSMSGHTHTVGSHTHSIATHTHTIPSDNITLQIASYWARQTPSGLVVADKDHLHTATHSHSGVTVTAVGGTGASGGSTSSGSSSGQVISTNTSGTPVADSTGSDGSHNHTISQDGTWRPSYLNVMICSRDNDPKINIRSVVCSPWFSGERTSYEKFTENTTDIINRLIDNIVDINDVLELLLQGAIGGIEQAIIPFAIASSPTGWTRHIASGNDNIIRVTDGSTLPPGAVPTATGGAIGGSWTIIGTTSVAAGSHTHTMNNHTHSLNAHTHTITHTHIMTSHTHVIDSHTHTINTETGLVSSVPTVTTDQVVNYSTQLSYYSTSDHTHTIPDHNHGGTSGVGSGTSGEASVANIDSTGAETGTPSSDTTGVPSTNTTGSNGSHSHVISYDSSWRPKYLNVLACSKD